jgi:carotenoid cleavage dioxygenase-like enzyme
MLDETDLPKGTQLYLSGIFAPVFDELTDTSLRIIGEIPRDLDGVFVHNGPNPRFRPNVGHSWFDGDGMVHSVQLENGRATFRCRISG